MGLKSLHTGQFLIPWKFMHWMIKVRKENATKMSRGRWSSTPCNVSSLIPSMLLSVSTRVVVFNLWCFQLLRGHFEWLSITILSDYAVATIPLRIYKIASVTYRTEADARVWFDAVGNLYNVGWCLAVCFKLSTPTSQTCRNHPSFRETTSSYYLALLMRWECSRRGYWLTTYQRYRVTMFSDQKGHIFESA